MVSVPPSLPLCLKDGYTALMMASHNGHTATVELLLGAGADTEAKNKVRETKRAIYTHTCGYQNGLKEVAPCLREHLYMCSTNSLHTLTCICHLLINSSTSHFPHVFLFFPIFATMVCASLSLCCKGAYTALMWASNSGRTATVELLLGAGADKEAKGAVREA